MSPATRKKTGADATSMTPLTGGFQVPERFTTSPPLVHRYIRVQCQVSVEMIGGRPHVRALAIEATGPPLSPADLAKLDLTQMLDAAVQQEARKQAPPLEWASAKDPVPFRVRARSSSFSNLSITNEICAGCLIADVPAIVGSIDIVMGEIDR